MVFLFLALLDLAGGQAAFAPLFLGFALLAVGADETKQGNDDSGQREPAQGASDAAAGG
jgi:hypothetical protein